MNRRTTALAETRAQQFALILAGGGGRRACFQLASDQGWAVTERSLDNYLRLAREKLQADWTIERRQMVADLLSQLSTIQMEARRRGQLSVALGCINAAARLAQIIN